LTKDTVRIHLRSYGGLLTEDLKNGFWVMAPAVKDTDTYQDFHAPAIITYLTHKYPGIEVENSNILAGTEEFYVAICTTANELNTAWVNTHAT